jgi:hypothetical protein
MKLFLAIFILSTSSFASTTDSHLVRIDGQESREGFSLYTTTTRTEYRTQTVERICYRTIIDGYRRVCNRYSDIVQPRPPRDPRDPNRPLPPRDPHYPNPRPEPRPEPRPIPRPPVCYDEPIYRTVPYTCYETINTPYEVIDHNTVSNLNVILTPAESINNNTTCNLNFEAIGDNVSAQTNCNEILAISNSTLAVGYDRGTRMQNIDYSIKLFDRQKLIAPLAGGLANMHLEGQNLVVVTGDLNNSKNFNLKLFVERRKFLRDDEVILNRTLQPTEFSFEANGGNTGLLKIDLARLLGGINTSKKHKIKLQLDVVLPAGNILNTNGVNTHQESEITVWDN